MAAVTDFFQAHPTLWQALKLAFTAVVTIVAVTLNICSIVLLFTLIRALTGLVIGGIEFARGFPMLRQGDSLLGAALGVLHGALLLFVIFMLLPVALVVLPRVYTFISESYFGTFFYRANPFIRLVPFV